MARRNAHQTVFATFAAVIGVLITFKLMSMVGRNRSEEVFSGELPDIELRHVSPQELFEEFAAGKDRPGFRRQAHAPQTWDDISLRVYWHGGEKLQVMDCLIDGNEIEHIAKGFFTNPGRRRPVDDLPPDWFPWERDADDSPWRVPDWWAPNPAGVGSYYVTPIEGGYLFGAYLHYHPATGRAHLWQFKRRGIQPPPLSRGELVVDYLASNISNTLRQDQHPHIEGWYDAPGLDPRTLGLPEEMIPPGVTRIDALLFPWKKEPQRFRYFMRIHGLDSARAYELISEIAMRPLAPDTPPPVKRWAFALPATAVGGELPVWFAPHAGPRWGYALARPGTGRVDRGRWAAYDAEREQLFVWDWDYGEPQPASADLFAPPATDAVDSDPGREQQLDRARAGEGEHGAEEPASRQPEEDEAPEQDPGE